MKLTAAPRGAIESLYRQLLVLLSVRQTMPILANVLLVAKNGEVAVTATDLEVELVAVAAVQVDTAGEVTVPGKEIAGYLSSVAGRGGDYRSARRGEKLSVALRDGVNSALTTLPAAEFPTVDDINAGQKIGGRGAAGDVLARLLRKDAFFYGAAGCTVLPEWFVAGDRGEAPCERWQRMDTDWRFARWSSTVENDDASEQQVIVPRKGVLELQRLLSGEGAVELELGSNHIRAQLEGIRFTSKLIDGRFPEYERVIPAEADKRACR